MDKYLLPTKSSPETPKSTLRGNRQWGRSLLEVTGKLDPNYRHDLSSLLMHSYSQIGKFPHNYHENDSPCVTHVLYGTRNYLGFHPAPRGGVSAIEFDSKGVYLASVTKSGCLTIHDFEALYCYANDVASKRPDSEEDESKLVLHLQLELQLSAVRWNPANQDEVACTSSKSDEVRIFDIGYVSSQPAQVLRARKNVTISGSQIRKGLTDIAFSTNDESRLFASDTNGTVNIWDRRQSGLPCLELTSNDQCNINSIQLNVDDQMVFGAGRLGIIYMWDLRGGRDSSGLQRHKEQACHSPVMSWKLDSVLKKIRSLTAQSNIVAKEIHSIDLNPSSPYQLAFHLDNGWSGVFDINNLRVTHVHCPPPAWLNDSNSLIDDVCFRKPSWLQTYSMYAVGSAAETGIHLLDFYPNATSPCHVDYSDDFEGLGRRRPRNQYISLDDNATVCAAHPLNGTIIAGTSRSSLVLVSNGKRSVDSVHS